MKADVLIFAAHPDDAEMSCGGTIASLTSKGKKVVICDLTQGEMGTRGTTQTRKAESESAGNILGISERVQLYLPDTAFDTDRKTQIPVIETIRRFKPEIVICNAITDRHPDHGRASSLESDACFYSGLSKIETSYKDQKQENWRPRLVFHYIQDRMIKPDFVVDISQFWKTKLEAIRAFKTQFFDPNSTEPETYISSAVFWDFLESRGREMGHIIEVSHGEGFTVERPLGVEDLMGLK